MENLICPYCRRKNSRDNENDIGGRCSCGKYFFICPKCSGFKWATKVKGKAWKCRECGLIQAIDGFDIQELKTEKMIREYATAKESKNNFILRFIDWLFNLFN